MSTPAVRASSGLVTTALADVRERVAYWLERARASGQHDLPDAVVRSLAGVAATAASGVLADVYRAGVQSGRVGAALQTGAVLPDGPETCRCPHCHQEISTP